MKNLKDLILEKLKRSHEYASNNDVTYEKFIDVFQDLGNHTIYFENHLGLIGDDYPTFNGYPGMDAALNKCVGKKFKSMTLERNSKNQLELHLNFKRSIGNITNIVILEIIIAKPLSLTSSFLIPNTYWYIALTTIATKPNGILYILTLFSIYAVKPYVSEPYASL